jgi:ABC-type transport system involved in Fe-S cluster assembly fused permease/ATPase subunit
VIAHRFSTVYNADKIIVLNNGVISEEGTHKELIEYSGLYFDLYMRQQKIPA